MEDQVRPDRNHSAKPAGLPLESEAQLSPQIEKFSAAELTNLRNELRGQLDSWQAAELAANFLAGHGYGASAEKLREAITSVEMSRCSNECLQAALEGVAYVQ
jgi:hypothetical protein